MTKVIWFVQRLCFVLSLGFYCMLLLDENMNGWIDQCGWKVLMGKFVCVGRMTKIEFCLLEFCCANLVSHIYFWTFWCAYVMKRLCTVCVLIRYHFDNEIVVSGIKSITTAHNLIKFHEITSSWKKSKQQLHSHCHYYLCFKVYRGSLASENLLKMSRTINV